MEAPVGNWLAYHLYYEQPWERVVTEVVAPVAGRLLRDASIDRFFFVRFELGGRHVRFRMRVRPSRSDRVEAEVVRTAAELFRRAPSSRACDEETIRDRNRVILASDPSETEDRVFPDNSCRRAAFVEETSRYGGPRGWATSLDFFCASSVEAFSFLDSFGPAARRSRQLVSALQRLIRQAWGLARNERELRSLVGYGMAGWGASLRGIVDLADRQLVRRAEMLRRLVARELATLSLGDSAEESAAPRPGEPGWIAEAAYRLSGDMPDGSGETAPGDPRWELGASHLHMTANRLGLTNPEEVYLSRLAGRTLGDLKQNEPEVLAQVDASLRERAPAEPGSLGRWLDRVLDSSLVHPRR